MQFFKPENYFEVRKALLDAGRADLIGRHRDALIPSEPPREAVLRRRKDAGARLRGDEAPTAPDRKEKTRSRRKSRNESAPGYRPERKSTR
jgi:hypothetical protein